jgi:hypothetical protein
MHRAMLDKSQVTEPAASLSTPAQNAMSALDHFSDERSPHKPSEKVQENAVS